MRKAEATSSANTPKNQSWASLFRQRILLTAIPTPGIINPLGAYAIPKRALTERVLGSHRTSLRKDLIDHESLNRFGRSSLATNLDIARDNSESAMPPST